MTLHCATPTVSPPAARPCRHHGACGALLHPAAAPPALTFGHRPRLVASAGDARADRALWRVRRRVRYDEDDEDDEEWGHNEDFARMERYTEDARDQALLVKARVDDEVELVVLVFKGFSSSLSGGTAADPSRSILPERAIIQSVDVVKGPFDPTNIEYLEKGVEWDDFKSRLQ
ncbi:unnamed protein product [Urochloa decumbens]|uniref:DUF7734 domain-containing protein n=1 Tax=Urochloa decumbens TaxID=240449 RepID=A0ABC8Y0H7_9POAL